MENFCKKFDFQVGHETFVPIIPQTLDEMLRHFDRVLLKGVSHEL